MRETTWLDSLAVGSAVIVCSSGYGTATRAVRPVARITPTQLVIGTSRFRRRDGWELASGYHRAWLEEATPERVTAVLAEEQRRANYELVRNQSWKALDDATLEAVAELLRHAVTPAPRAPETESAAHPHPNGDA